MKNPMLLTFIDAADKETLTLINCDKILCAYADDDSLGRGHTRVVFHDTGFSMYVKETPVEIYEKVKTCLNNK